MAVRTADSGVKTRMKKHSDPAVPREKRALYFLAMLFGSISPTKKTTTVVMTVLSVTALTPQRRVTSTVT